MRIRFSAKVFCVFVLFQPFFVRAMEKTIESIKFPVYKCSEEVLRKDKPLAISLRVVKQGKTGRDIHIKTSDSNVGHWKMSENADNKKVTFEGFESKEGLKKVVLGSVAEKKENSIELQLNDLRDESKSFFHVYKPSEVKDRGSSITQTYFRLWKEREQPFRYSYWFYPSCKTLSEWQEDNESDPELCSLCAEQNSKISNFRLPLFLIFQQYCGVPIILKMKDDQSKKDDTPSDTPSKDPSCFENLKDFLFKFGSMLSGQPKNNPFTVVLKEAVSGGLLSPFDFPIPVRIEETVPASSFKPKGAFRNFGTKSFLVNITISD